jgi:hypothetical protein
VNAEVATDVPEGLPNAAEPSRFFDLVAVQGGVATLGPSTVQVVQHGCPVDAKVGSQLIDGGSFLVRLDQAADLVVRQATLSSTRRRGCNVCA